MDGGDAAEALQFVATCMQRRRCWLRPQQMHMPGGKQQWRLGAIRAAQLCHWHIFDCHDNRKAQHRFSVVNMEKLIKTKTKQNREEKLYRAPDLEGHGNNNNTENRTEQGNTRF